eukprot:gene8774-10400_t
MVVIMLMTMVMILVMTMFIIMDITMVRIRVVIFINIRVMTIVITITMTMASTTVTIVKGSPPVPAIAPLPQKHTPNSKLTLISEVQSLRPETLQRMWSVEAGGGAPVDLASVSSTTLDGPNLVLKPNALAAGAEYWFTLSATDGNGPSSVKLQTITVKEMTFEDDGAKEHFIDSAIDTAAADATNGKDTSSILVDVTRTGDPDSQLGREGAAAIMEGLSSVTVGAVLDRGANQSSEVAMAVEVVRAIGFSNMQSMVPEEEAAVVATEVLSSYARRADLTSSASQALTEPLLSPNGVALRLSSSLGSVLGEAAAAADIMMVGSAVDPNGASDTAREAAAHRLLLGTPPAASRALLASDVTSISLFSSANGSELAVHNLQVIDSVWTWSIVDHRAENSGEQSAPSGPTLGTMFGQLAAKEKARLVAEREGTMIRRVASKWKR